MAATPESETSTVDPLAHGAWIAAVSHDLREPMNAILGMTRLLLETELDDAQRRYAEIVEDAAGGMMTLVNDLLDMSRLARGDVVIRAEPFDLHRLLRGSADVVKPRVGDRSITLNLEIDPATPVWVTGDAGRLRQILVNLLANALKCTTEGEVALAVRPAGEGRLAFEVRDTGCGVAPVDRARIFEPFVQLPTGGEGGVGLGLAIARLLVDRLDGTLGLVSELGAGSTFTATLPLPAATPPPTRRRASLAGRRVLLVADATALRDRTRQALEAVEARVLLEETAEAATRTLARAAAVPDALLVVADEPDETSAELARRLAEARADVVLLALAPTGVRGAPEAWRRAGFIGYLPYPVGADLLTDALGVLLATPPAERHFVTQPGLRDRLGRAVHVLAVDDNPLNGRLVRILLEKAGHRVSLVEDGLAAVAAVAEGDVDAVLMDVQMPGISGPETARRIRALAEPAASTPIVAVTANAGAEEAAACRAAGMDGFVTKPIDRGTLLDALADALGARDGAR